MDKRFVILLFLTLLSWTGCKVSTSADVPAESTICSATDYDDTQEEMLFRLSMPRPALPANIEKTQPFSIQLTVRRFLRPLRPHGLQIVRAPRGKNRIWAFFIFVTYI